MDYQIFFNIAIGAAGAAGGWILNRVYVALDRLDKDVREMPFRYVNREDYRRDIYEIKDICRQIFDRLDHKVDK